MATKNWRFFINKSFTSKYFLPWIFTLSNLSLKITCLLVPSAVCHFLAAGGLFARRLRVTAQWIGFANSLRHHYTKKSDSIDSLSCQKKRVLAVSFFSAAALSEWENVECAPNTQCNKAEKSEWRVCVHLRAFVNSRRPREPSRATHPPFTSCVCAELFEKGLSQQPNI